MPSEQVETQDTGESERRPVLEVFGIKLQVSNPRFAELLTMDAKDALTSDVRELVGPGAPSSSVEAPVTTTADSIESDPDHMLETLVPEDETAVQRRRDFRRVVQEAGQALGFDAGADGVWRSPTGLTLLTRSIERPVSFATASHFVSEVATRRQSICGEDCTALFVVDGQATADVFKVAVRQLRLHDIMRTVSFDNLLELRRLSEFGTLDHQQAVVLLVPMATVDVGEILSIMRTSRADELPDELD